MYMPLDSLQIISLRVFSSEAKSNWRLSSPPPGDSDGAAKFLSHVPYDETYDRDELDPDMPDFDADVKIPGRHYPKLPYGHPFHAHNAGGASHHAQSYQPGHAGGSQQARGQTGHWLGQGYYPDQRPASPRHDQGFQSDHGDDQDYYQNNQLYDQTHRNGGAGYGQGTGGGGWRKDEDEDDYNDFDDDHDPEEESQVSATQMPAGPHFDRSLPRSITVQAGKTARLVCRVFDIGETSVSDRLPSTPLGASLGVSDAWHTKLTLISFISN